MARKKFHFALEEKIHQKIKELASRHGCRPGNVIEALVILVQTGQVGHGVLSSGVQKTRRTWGWEADHVDELIQKFENLRELAKQAGDTSTAAAAEAKIKALRAEYGLVEED